MELIEENVVFPVSSPVFTCTCRGDVTLVSAHKPKSSGTLRSVCTISDESITDVTVDLITVSSVFMAQLSNFQYRSCVKVRSPCLMLLFQPKESRAI